MTRIIHITCIALSLLAAACVWEPQPSPDRGPDAGATCLSTSDGECASDAGAVCGFEGGKCCPADLSPDGAPDWCAADLACGAVVRGLCGPL